MKKLFLTLGLGLCLTTAFAQSTEEERNVGTTTKSGQKILPQAGDVAIGIDATGVLNYLGNSLNGSTKNSSSNIFNYGKESENIFEAPSIYGKYFLTDKTAIRVKLHLGFNSNTEKSEVSKTGTTTDEKVENKTTDSKSGLGLSVGYELRRGYGRLQGYFGPEVGLGFSSTSTSYTFGNPINAENPLSYRLLKETDPSDFAIKAGGFAGVEYFVAPKLSIGGELGLGLLYNSVGKEKIESEGWNGSAVEKKTKEDGGGSKFNFSTVYTGSLNVTFHF